MALSGHVAQLRIREETGVRPFTNVLLELSSKKTNAVATIRTSSSADVVCRFRLKDCIYLEDSSQPGSVECIRNEKTDQSLIFLDQNKTCTALFDHIRKCLREPIADESDDDELNESIEKLTKALAESDPAAAAEIARTLANSPNHVNFVLNMINESDDVVKARKPPPPVIRSIKLKLSIETHKMTQMDNQEYDLAVLPHTTVLQLKQMIAQEIGIDVASQYWFHKQDLLDDKYVFGDTVPHLNDGASLVLYITKPQ